MSEDAPDTIATLDGEAPVEEPLVVKLPPVVMHAMALTTLIEHGMKQSKVIQDMLAQATFALDRARAAPNEGTGSVLKMVTPVMIHRKKYLSQEIQMWALVMEAAECDLEDLKPELDEIDRLNKEREGVNGGSDVEANTGEGEAAGGGGGGECAPGECACGPNAPDHCNGDNCIDSAGCDDEIPG